MIGFLVVSAVVGMLWGAVALRLQRLEREWKSPVRVPKPRWGTDGGTSRRFETNAPWRAAAGTGDGGAFPSRAVSEQRNSRRNPV